MSSIEEPRTPERCIEALAETSTRRPVGMVGWMHYGYALRYGGIRDFVEGEDEWRQLDKGTQVLGKNILSRVVPLLEARAWTAGNLLLRQLPSVVWQDLTPVARGHYLAGLSTHMRRAANPDSIEFLIADQLSGTDSPDLFDVTGELLQRLPTVSLDEEVAAEIGANAIHSGRLDVLRTILSRPDLPEGPVCRVGERRDTRRWEKQLSQHSTRVKDVLLEAAVRCHHAEAMRLLLDCGASPDIPCWNLERSYNQWFCALSFAIHAATEHTTAVAQAMIDALLDHGADPQGLECDGRNHPLMRAMLQQEWRLADRLLALGAKFEGGQDSSEFWPFLRHLEDNTIGMTEESCRAIPDMLDTYSVWERQNKPDKSFEPDPRLLAWPMWPKVPVELRPYFYFDEVIGKPSITFNSRNDYEKEMIHKAVQWHNAGMIQSMKDAGIL